MISTLMEGRGKKLRGVELLVAMSKHDIINGRPISCSLLRKSSFPPSPPLPSAFIISLAVYRWLRSNGWKLFLRESSACGPLTWRMD